MKTHWIVENFTHESSYMDLVKSIKKLDMPLQEIKGDFKYSMLNKYDGEEPFIFLGSINMVELVNRQFQHKPRWKSPFIYGTMPNYLCSKYMSRFGAYLFNDKYALISLSELVRQKDFYYSTFGKESTIFIRPDSGAKTFQAQLVEYNDLNRFAEKAIDNWHDLVVVSTPKTVEGEWRFVVSSQNKIIACSTYRLHGQVCKTPDAPKEATDLVKEMLNIGYYPDEVFIMDVCQGADTNYYLLELNSFSSAGLYACDKDAIVKEVSEITLQTWELCKRFDLNNL